MDSTLRRLTVLIVDDHPAIRRLIRTLIAASATDVVECANGVEAVRPTARATGRGPDGFRDAGARRPGAPGRFEPPTRRRIVIVTNHDDADLQDAAHRAGASGYVLKANLFDLERLLNGVLGT